MKIILFFKEGGIIVISEIGDRLVSYFESYEKNDI